MIKATNPIKNATGRDISTQLRMFLLTKYNIADGSTKNNQNVTVKEIF